MRTLRLGLLARANNRGLGIQSWEVYRNMDPAVTVVIDCLPDAGRWQQYPDRYPGAVFTEWAGYTAPISKEAFDALMTCDVIWTAETWYDPDIPTVAKAKGIATVIMVNPELWREHETEPATKVWAPTKWRIEHIPRAELVSMPVALDRLEGNPVGDRLLHLGGHKARQDRNGMETSIRAARMAGVDMTVTSQDRIHLSGRGITQGPTLDNYWEMYEGYGVLVMPRKYGGLCLPVQEAMAAGLAVIMTNTSPNDDWPVSLVECRRTQRIKLPGGDIDIYESDRGPLAAEMRLMSRSEYRAEWQAKGKEWARTHSWNWYKSEWMARLAELS